MKYKNVSTIEEKKKHKRKTGWETPGELHAYEQGRNNEQKATVKWLKSWDGTSDSFLGQVINKRITELVEERQRRWVIEKYNDLDKTIVGKK